MDESPDAGKVQEAGTPPWGFFSPNNVGHCPHGGTGLLSTVVCRATPVLWTVATTEVAGDLSDGSDGVEPSSPNASGISFRNKISIVKLLQCPLLFSGLLELNRCVLLHVINRILY